MKLLAASLLGLAVLSGIDTSAAYSTANRGAPLFYPRTCHEETVVISDAPPVVRPGDLVPVRKIHKPARLEVVPHTVDDAAYAEPVPERAGTAPPSAPIVVTHLQRESRNHWGCLGIQRGRAGILRVLESSPGTRFYGHPDPAGFIGDNILAAVAFDLHEAIPALRKLLERPPVDHEIDRTSLRAQAAHGLAMLGDRDSIPKLEAFTTELENEKLSSVWRSTFLSLVEIDPDTASHYVISLLERMTGSHPPDRVRLDEVTIALPHILARDAAKALPLLQKLSAKDQLPNSYPNHSMCQVLGARVRLGDEPMAKVVRPAIEGNLDNNLATVCYSQFIEALAPGKSVKELPLLTYRGRYEELAELALSVHLKSDKTDRATLLKGLRKMIPSATQHFGNRNGQFGISSQYGYFLSALALAGDEKSIGELNTLIESPTESTDAPWVAARYAVLGDLPGAVLRAKKRLEIGERVGLDHGQLDTAGVGVAVNEGVRLVRALAAKNEPVFSLALYVRDHHVREEAMMTLSRKKPAAACEILGEGARASDEFVESTFWAMSVLGVECRTKMEALAGDRSVSEHVSGMALEHLAMTRAPTTATLASKWRSAGPRGTGHLDFVRIIMSSPE